MNWHFLSRIAQCNLSLPLFYTFSMLFLLLLLATFLEAYRQVRFLDFFLTVFLRITFLICWLAFPQSSPPHCWLQFCFVDLVLFHRYIYICSFWRHEMPLIVHVLWLSGEASMADNRLHAQCAQVSGMNYHWIITCPDKASPLRFSCLVTEGECSSLVAQEKAWGWGLVEIIMNTVRWPHL